MTTTPPAAAAGTETWQFTPRERAYLIDAVMVLMHQMEQVRLRQSDPSQLPELQRLLERLMNDTPGPGTGAEAIRASLRDLHEEVVAIATEDDARLHRIEADATHARLMVDALCRAAGGPAREALEDLEDLEAEKAR